VSIWNSSAFVSFGAYETMNVVLPEGVDCDIVPDKLFEAPEKVTPEKGNPFAA
jgi:hypothetical protein